MASEWYRVIVRLTGSSTLGVIEFPQELSQPSLMSFVLRLHNNKDNMTAPHLLESLIRAICIRLWSAKEYEEKVLVITG